MKITNKQLKQIIKEELEAVMSEKTELDDDPNVDRSNDLINSNGQSFLLSRRFILGDTYMPGQPDHHAEVVKQALRGDLDRKRGIKSAKLLKPMVEKGHPLITTDKRAKQQLIDFLNYAIKKLEKQE